MANTVKKSKKTVSSTPTFDDVFECDDDLLKQFEEADKEASSSLGNGAAGESTPNESDEDLRNKWNLSTPEETSYYESLESSMTSLEQKLAKLLDANSERGKAYEAMRQKMAQEAVEKAKTAGNHEHESLPDVVHMLKTVGVAFLVGPTGTGKSTLAKQACKKLFELDGDPIVSGKYAQISFSPDTTSGEMIGRTDVNGGFHESEIVRVFRDGGLILFDEIDDADPSMLIKVNTALANGYLATPTGMVVRNKETYIVCAANTFGTGPDAMYVGRTRLDAATLDRFCLSTVYVDYDRQLEDTIADQLDPERHYWLTGYVDKVRNAIKKGKLRRACSTRFVINAVAHMLAGKTPRWVNDNYLQGWTLSERAKLKEIETDVI